MAKMLAAEGPALRAGDACIQTHGGFGFAEHDIERKYRERLLYSSRANLHQPDPVLCREHVLGCREATN
jgi:alkylation response protein AidB-like acyl-CoA dehydrogenase